LSLCLTKHCAMNAYVAVDVYIHVLLTSALVGDEWLASRPCSFISRERASSTLRIGGWVRPRASLDDMDELKFLTLPGLDLRLPRSSIYTYCATRLVV
jgi:hypothetical protein